MDKVDERKGKTNAGDTQPMIDWQGTSAMQALHADSAELGPVHKLEAGACSMHNSAIMSN